MSFIITAFQSAVFFVVVIVIIVVVVVIVVSIFFVYCRVFLFVLCLGHSSLCGLKATNMN